MSPAARPALPLWGWTAASSVATGGVIVGGTLTGLGIGGGLTARAVSWCLGLGVGTTVLVTVLGVWSAHRTSLALRTLRDEALARLRDPTVEIAETTNPRIRDTAELAELAAALDALALRMRVADELAVRHRTAAEQSSAGMSELLSGLTAAEEGARGQLSAELHDTVAQSLALARSRLADGDLSAAHDLVDEAEDQVRALMARTRPPALRDGDLGSAVGNLRDEMLRRYGLVVHVSWPTQAVPLPLPTAVTVYRFLQEALLNVVKHADVDSVSATLAVEGGAVLATVVDRGLGFDPAEVRSERGRHVGLGLLRERVRLAGGSVTLVSALGDGTTLTLRMPLSGRPLSAVAAATAPTTARMRTAVR